MMELAEWYTETTKDSPLGFFQIGGGIAGDFPICVVPMLHQDLQREHVPLWAYFCQISDSTTSYGSYSGAVPNEKITWGKLGEKTPKFIVESDASIVAPLMLPTFSVGRGKSDRTILSILNVSGGLGNLLGPAKIAPVVVVRREGKYWLAKSGKAQVGGNDRENALFAYQGKNARRDNVNSREGARVRLAGIANEFRSS